MRGTEHLSAAVDAIRTLSAQAERVDRWGRALADVLATGGRLLACGNGGSAAQAQHLTAELVGRFETERRPLSAICLSAETSSLTAISNDYRYEEVFARQVRAHGRPGDVLIGLSTSGSSANVLAAAESAHEIGMRVLAFTGPLPNPLGALADGVVAVDARSPATIQEGHLVLIHALCAAIDEELPSVIRLEGSPAEVSA